MSGVQSFLLVLLICSPVLAFGQRPITLPDAPPQTAPPSSTSDPVLLPRPPVRSVHPGAITPEGRIQLDVVVSDSAGKAVPGLGPQDFKLLDNNQSRRILSFRSFDGIAVKPEPPVEIILLVDTVNLPFPQLSFTRQAIARFLSQNGGHLAQPVSIMLLTEAGLRIQPRASVDGNALLSVLDGIQGGIPSVNSTMGAEGQLSRLQLSVRQMAAIAENEVKRPGRKLLIWVGPGWPMLESNRFSFSDRDQRRYFDAIVELSTRMREARMALYSVALSDSAVGAGAHTTFYQGFLKGVQAPQQADTGNLALKVLALQSGGRVLGPDNDLAGQINKCVADANVFYTISFNSPVAAHADEYHDLKVEVAQPGLTARTTSGYYNQP